jgi:hypothetical protein
MANDESVTAGPAIMHPELEAWTRAKLGNAKFELMRDRPLIAVALAAQSPEAGEGQTASVSTPLLESWASLIASKRREIEESQAALLRLLDNPETSRGNIPSLLGFASDRDFEKNRESSPPKA